VKIRRDVDWPLEDLAVVVLLHVGEWGVSSDNLHMIWAVEALEQPWDFDWAGVVGPWAPAGTIVRPAIDGAMCMARLMVALPNVAQDVCYICREGARGPNCPRFNIYHDGPARVITPCVLEYWH
jgi:hypothetical protein